MNVNTALLLFQMKIDLGLPHFPALIQQNDQKSVLCNPEACGLLLDISMDFCRKPDLCCHDSIF